MGSLYIYVTDGNYMGSLHVTSRTKLASLYVTVGNHMGPVCNEKRKLRHGTRLQ
jgi:hypothetical protein